MNVNRRFFPSIILDDEEVYFQKLIGTIESVDELASLEIIKAPTKIQFRIAPSLPKYNKMLLEEILKLNNVLHIRLDLSKSIKASSTICFNIDL